uniref:Poly [ADP-ribose] polymerase n=1 Tax=Mastacembelus armatus TaxID=205130 RepID=A0A7N9B1T9_9TELE
MSVCVCVSVCLCVCVCVSLSLSLSLSLSASASASIGPVLSPSLGIHQMQMGALTLEVSSGDITKESSDVIVNSSNPDFTLKSGVSKAILDGAGSAVEEECSQIGYQSSPMIRTSAGKLPSKNILHVVGQNDPAKINEMVLRVLNVCEENKFSSVSLPALGTGLCQNLTVVRSSFIQNATLWQNYQLMKKQMEVKNKHTNNEKLLFHGTGAGSIDLINTKGFNRGYAGTNGAMFGNGSYFAVDPAYSVGYAKPDAKGHKRMYLTRLLAGDFTQGKAGMITPPSRGSGNAADLYDSVTDKTANPTMFVVFNDIQAYPEYLITFT